MLYKDKIFENTNLLATLNSSLFNIKTKRIYTLENFIQKNFIQSTLYESETALY